eukprot:3276783-Ditylum_brightwellii.AAC.1
MKTKHFPEAGAETTLTWRGRRDGPTRIMDPGVVHKGQFGNQSGGRPDGKGNGICSWIGAGK